MQVDSASQLSARQSEAVVALAERATRADGVAPLSEHVLLHVRHSGVEQSAQESDEEGAHFLSYDGTHLLGYAHLERGSAGEPPSAEVVVDPAARRHGVGTALVDALVGALEGPSDGSSGASSGGPLGASGAYTGASTGVSTGASTDLRLWSHGHLEMARAFARRDGFGNVRELWQMRRPLGDGSDPLPPAVLPGGFAARPFVPGQDEHAWLAVNARAFATHPEQGRMSLADLTQREAERWFDAAGFILVERLGASDGEPQLGASDGEPRLAAFHWTKVHQHGTAAGETGSAAVPHPALGEVYVVGVDPAYQGLGLGRAVTILGLEHLQRRGLGEAMLYVDGDNEAAVATYTRLGFVRSAVDVMYSRVVHPAVPR